MKFQHLILSFFLGTVATLSAEPPPLINWTKPPVEIFEKLPAAIIPEYSISIDDGGNAIAAAYDPARPRTVVTSFLLTSAGIWTKPSTVPFIFGKDKVLVGAFSSTDNNEENRIPNAILLAATTRTIQVSQYTAATNRWSNPTELRQFQNDEINTSSINLSVASNGYAVVIWARTVGSSIVIQGAQLQPGSNNWVSLSDIQTNVPRSLSSTFVPVLALQRNGNPIVTWANNAGIIRVATLANRVWSKETPLSGPVSSFPIVACQKFRRRYPLSDISQAMVAWIASDKTLQASTFDGSTWSAPVPIPGSNQAGRPSLDMDGRGNAFLAWKKQTNGLIKAARYNVVEGLGPPGWSTVTGTEKPDGSNEISLPNSEGPKVMMDVFGSVLLVWKTIANTSYLYSGILPDTIPVGGPLVPIPLIAQGDSSESIRNSQIISGGRRGKSIVAWSENLKYRSSEVILYNP